MPSKYISGYSENPEYSRLANLRDQLDDQARAIDREDDRYRDCEDKEKRQGIYGDCRKIRDQYRAEYNKIKSESRRVENSLAGMESEFPIITSYTYTQNNIRVEARLKVGFLMVDSLCAMRSEQEVLSEEETKEGTEIQGAMPEDRNGITDTLANLPSKEKLFAQQVTKIHRKLTEMTTAYLRSLPERYLGRAREAKNRNAMDEAAENYILFLATSPQKSGDNHQEAAHFLQKEKNLVYHPEID